MARIKTFFKDYQELAHVWAAQTQAEGHTTGRRMFFEDRSIFSYGHHFEIARFVNVGKASIVLYTSRDYSPTTSKHKWATRRAVEHEVMFTVPSFDNHNSNVDFWIADIPKTIERMKRAHTPALLSGIQNNIKAAKSYIRWFGRAVTSDRKRAVNKYFKKIDSLIPAELLEKLKTREAALEERTRKASEARRERYEKMRFANEQAWAEDKRLREEKKLRDRENLPADLERWKNGEEVDNEFMYEAPIMLRITENEIETSRHARIPLIEARKFWSMIGRRENVVGMRLGYYTVDGLDGSTLTVGCHKIPLREVYRMARALQWDNGLTREVAQ